MFLYESFDIYMEWIQIGAIFFPSTFGLSDESYAFI